MKLDIVTNALVAENDVYADLVSAGVFDREGLVRAEELSEEYAALSYTDTGGRKRALHCDCPKRVKSGRLGEFIMVFENQAKISNAMPVRKLGYVYAFYQRQVSAYEDANAAEGRPAYAEGLHEGQKLVPVVLRVLYWGTKEWTEPLSLRDMLQDSSAEESVLWEKYMDDLSLEVISMANLPEETRRRLHSDIRVIADYLAYRNDWEKFCEEIRHTKQVIKHRSKVLDVLEALSGDRRFRKLKELLIKEYGEEQEEIGMCEMLDRIEEVGREKGLAEGEKLGIAKGEKLGIAKGEKRGLRTGRREGEKTGLQKGEQKARLASIKALMKNMSMTAEQAMKLLNIPRKERAFYLEKL